MKITLSRRQWEMIGKKSSLDRNDVESYEDNPYIKDYDAFSRDSGIYSMHVNYDGKNLGWMSGPYYGKACDVAKKTIIDYLEKNLPYNKNGTVLIEITFILSRENEDKEVIEWKTHPLLLKKISQNDLFGAMSTAIEKANSVDKYYKEYLDWQNSLEEEKEKRKSGYYGYQRLTPEERTKKRLEERKKKTEQEEALDYKMPSNPPIATLGDAFPKAMANSKIKIKISNRQWKMMK